MKWKEFIKNNAQNDNGSTLFRGMAAAWPICLGYAPIGLAFGVLAQKAGLTPLEIGLMSVIVFAGSSQFIAVSMLAAGASVFSIVTTTFIVNLRHFLMSSALAVYLKNWLLPVHPGPWIFYGPSLWLPCRLFYSQSLQNH